MTKEDKKFQSDSKNLMSLTARVTTEENPLCTINTDGNESSNLSQWRKCETKKLHTSATLLPVSPSLSVYPVKRHRPDKELRRPGRSGEAPSSCKKSGGRRLGGGGAHTQHQSDQMPEMVRRDSGDSVHNTPKRTTIPFSDHSGNRSQ